MPKLPAEHFLFRAYSIAVKNWLQNNLYLTSYPPNNNITVVYQQPDVAFSKYYNAVLNGSTLSPNINFHLTGYEYLQNQNLLGFVSETKRYINENKAKIVKPPLIYQLTYSCVIYARNQSEMDVIIYQMVSQGHKNKKAVLTVDGQWAELFFGDPRDETNLEPGEAQGMMNRFGIDLIIPRAYLPLEYTEEQLINSMEFNYDLEEE